MPLTGLGVVNTIVTEFATFKFINKKLVLVAYTNDVNLEDIKNMTEAEYEVAPDVKVLEV